MPRALKLLLFASALAALLVVLCAPLAASAYKRQDAVALDPAVEHAVGLYTKGDAKGAVKELRSLTKRRRDDPLVWVYLGQALVMRGEMKEARKAFDAALKLKPDYAIAHSSLAYLLIVTGKTREAEDEAAKALALDTKLADAHYVVGLLRLRAGAWLKAIEEADAVIKLDPKIASAYSLKTQALLGLYERGNIVLSDERRGAYDFDDATIKEARAAQPLRLKEAADNLEKYLQLKPTAGDADELREELEALRFYADAAASTDPSRKIYAATEGITRALITYKPEPSFTEEARRAGITGVVRLRAVLGFDGKVKYILVLKGLSHGLTEKSVIAARQIRFRPAMLGGVPVSQYVVLEYNFNIY
jgi:TonB family protein